MKSLTEYLWFNTKERRELLNITREIEALVERSGVREGFCLVSAMHITASIWVNDDEPGLWQDFWELLERLAPFGPDYQHHRSGEDNGDAHLKRTLVGHQALLPVTDDRLGLSSRMRKGSELCSSVTEVVAADWAAAIAWPRAANA